MSTPPKIPRLLTDLTFTDCNRFDTDINGDQEDDRNDYRQIRQEPHTPDFDQDNDERTSALDWMDAESLISSDEDIDIETPKNPAPELLPKKPGSELGSEEQKSKIISNESATDQEEETRNLECKTKLIDAIPSDNLIEKEGSTLLDGSNKNGHAQEEDGVALDKVTAFKPTENDASDQNISVEAVEEQMAQQDVISTGQQAQPEAIQNLNKQKAQEEVAAQENRTDQEGVADEEPNIIQSLNEYANMEDRLNLANRRNQIHIIPLPDEGMSPLFKRVLQEKLATIPINLSQYMKVTCIAHLRLDGEILETVEIVIDNARFGGNILSFFVDIDLNQDGASTRIKREQILG